jgi:hypothetical protein
VSEAWDAVFSLFGRIEHPSRSIVQERGHLPKRVTLFDTYFCICYFELLETPLPASFICQIIKYRRCEKLDFLGIV